VPRGHRERHVNNSSSTEAR